MVIGECRDSYRISDVTVLDQAANAPACLATNQLNLQPRVIRTHLGTWRLLVTSTATATAAATATATANANMALGTLEVELLLAILEYVNEESPQTTRSASLVNKRFYAIARRTRYRRQTLQVTEAGRSRISELTAQPEALRSIRHLTVEGDPHTKAIGLDEIQSLTKFVQVLTNLRSLVWRDAGPIPLEVLDALHQYHPRATLKVYNWSRGVDDADHNDPAEIALAHSPALVGLQASIWNGPDLREAACKRIIANAPNLQYASVTTGRSGRVIHMLSPAERVELAEKEELFYTHKEPSRSLKALTLDGFGLSKQTIDQWGRFLDFSKLESLKCSRGFVPDKSYFELAPITTHKLEECQPQLLLQQRRPRRRCC